MHIFLMWYVMNKDKGVFTLLSILKKGNAIKIEDDTPSLEEIEEKENDDFGNSEVEETEKDNKKNKKVK